MGRLLGLDYGTKRVGIAISDSSQLIATPYEVVPSDAVLDALDSIVEQEDITGVIVGLPTSLSGEEGPSAAAARTLAERVAAHTGLDVTLVDERFTTKVADRALIERGMRREQRRDIRDKMAATVMLQGHLDSLR